MHLTETILMLLTLWPAQPGQSVLILSESQVVRTSEWSVSDRGQIYAGGRSAPGSRMVQSPMLLENVDNVVSSAPAGEAATSSVSLQLVNGEILRGRLGQAASADTLSLTTPYFGSIQLPMSQISMLLIGFSAADPPMSVRQAKGPCLILANGDVVSGTIRSISDQKVAIKSDFGDVQTDMARVVGILPTDRPAPADGRSAVQLLCNLNDGQRWYLDRIGPSTKDGQVRVWRGAQPVDLPQVAVRQLVFPGVTVEELTSRSKPEVETTPYLGGTVRVQVDDATHRRPRAIDGQAFSDGITAQPRSRITCQVPPGAAYLIGWVGLDPVRGSQGMCDVRVEADGKALMTVENLTARDGARRIALPLRGLSHITLVTDFGPRGQIGDWVNWCELRVVARTANTKPSP